VTISFSYLKLNESVATQNTTA